VEEESQETSEEEAEQEVSEQETSTETSDEPEEQVAEQQTSMEMSEEPQEQVAEQETLPETSEEAEQQVAEESDEPVVEPLEEQLQQEPSELPSSFTFTVASTDMKRFLGGTSSRGLIGRWTAFTYDKFNAVYPLCVLVFHYNHCRKSDSKKTTSPFWISRARCHIGNCIEVCNTWFFCICTVDNRSHCHDSMCSC